MQSTYPTDKLSIVGGGIVGALEAYFAFLDAKKAGKQIRVTIYEKNISIAETTTSHLVPSLTPDEILSVVPRGQLLVEKLKHSFTQPGGIRVDDVPNVNDSALALEFINQVQAYGLDEAGHEARTQTLLELGKFSMNFWRDIYESADPELAQILSDSNFNPCKEPSNSCGDLRNGYRIDLIYNVANAAKRAEAMRSDYESLGYKQCKLLSPQEVMVRDPALTTFCLKNSDVNDLGEMHWNNDAVALWRPGGCINNNTFLPMFYDYLRKIMGTYVNEKGVTKNCFQIKFSRNVTDVIYAEDKRTIQGLQFFGRLPKLNKAYKTSDYVFCPGEAVGTLRKLGFAEPAYAGFAGASLMLHIPVPKDKEVKLDHYMEVHQEGVVLAWQAQVRGDKIFIGVAGTKAFYADQQPHKDQAFALDRNLLQLNMINDVLPEFVSLALKKDTHNQKLTAEDLRLLEESGIAERWVGRRAVTYDGFPTVGVLHNNQGEVTNGRGTTHLGSGGCSFSPGVVFASRNAKLQNADPLIQDTLRYGSARRKPN